MGTVDDLFISMLPDKLKKCQVKGFWISRDPYDPLTLNFTRKNDIGKSWDKLFSFQFKSEASFQNTTSAIIKMLYTARKPDCDGSEFMSVIIPIEESEYVTLKLSPCAGVNRDRGFRSLMDMLFTAENDDTGNVDILIYISIESIAPVAESFTDAMLKMSKGIKTPENYEV